MADTPEFDPNEPITPIEGPKFAPDEPIVPLTMAQRQRAYREALRAGEPTMRAGEAAHAVAMAEERRTPEQLAEEWRQVGKGLAKGVPATLSGGFAGDIEEMARRFGKEYGVEQEPYLPTTVQGGYLGPKGLGVMAPAATPLEAAGMSLAPAMLPVPGGVLKAFKAARAAEAVPAIESIDLMTGLPKKQIGLPTIPTGEGIPVPEIREKGARLLSPEVSHDPIALPSRAGVGAEGAIGPLDGISTETINGISRQLKEDGWTPWTINEKLENMSPHQFFAEVSPNMRKNIAQNAVGGGEARNIVVNNLYQRHGETGQRLKTLYDNAFGPVENVFEKKKELTKEQKVEAGKFYDQFRKLEIAPTPELDEIITTLNNIKEAGGPNVFKEAKVKAAAENRPFSEGYFNGEEVKQYPSPESWDYIKRGLDKIIDNSFEGGFRPTDDTRVYTSIKNKLIDAIDNHPDPNVAGVWKQARDAYASRAKLKEAYDLGKKLLSDSIDFNEVPDLIGRAGEKELKAIATGVRYALENQLGRAGAQEGRSIRQMLSENAQKKIRNLVGEDKAEKLFKAVESEGEIYGAKTNLVGGSETGTRVVGEADQFWNKPSRTAEMAGTVAETGAGLIKEPGKTVRKAVSKLASEKMKKAAADKTAKLRSEAAQIYTLQGPERDAALRWLLEYGEDWPKPPKSPKGFYGPGSEGGGISGGRTLSAASSAAVSGYPTAGSAEATTRQSSSPSIQERLQSWKKVSPEEVLARGEAENVASQVSRMPDTFQDMWNERAAILEIGAGIPRHEAELKAFSEVKSAFEQAVGNPERSNLSSADHRDRLRITIHPRITEHGLKRGGTVLDKMHEARRRAEGGDVTDEAAEAQAAREAAARRISRSTIVPGGRPESEGYNHVPTLLAATASGFVPGAGIADYLGQMPDFEGGKRPSFSENFKEGRYLPATLQALGAGGDLAMGTPIAGPIVGEALKAPRALQNAAGVARSLAKGASEAASEAAAVARAAKAGDVASDLREIKTESGKPIAERGALGMAGGKIGNGGAEVRSPIGVQPEFTSPAVGSNIAAGSGSVSMPKSWPKISDLHQNDVVDLAHSQIDQIRELMSKYGYQFLGVKSSPLSEAQYLSFRTATPPAMSKLGKSELFKELKDQGISLANNPTGEDFQIRIAAHKSGSGGYPASQYEWSLHRTPEDNAARLQYLIDTMNRIAKDRPRGGALSPFANPNGALGMAGGKIGNGGAELPKLTKAGFDKFLADAGIPHRFERSSFENERFGPSASIYYHVEGPDGRTTKIRISDHWDESAKYDFRFGEDPTNAQIAAYRASGRELPGNLAAQVEAQKVVAQAAEVEAEAARAARYQREAENVLLRQYGYNDRKGGKTRARWLAAIAERQAADPFATTNSASAGIGDAYAQKLHEDQARQYGAKR